MKHKNIEMSRKRHSHATFLFGGIAFIGIASFSYFTVSSVLPGFLPVGYDSSSSTDSNTVLVEEAGGEILPPPFVATHVKTPEYVKALYMTSWVAGTPTWRASLADLIDKTELNAIVVDIKDYSGRVSFEVSDPLLKEIGSQEIRIPDIKEFIKLLHEKNIYVIGRITVFQDPYWAPKRPDIAVKKESDPTQIWKDYKGLSYIDPGAKEVWDYMVVLGKESYALGFDELNFDYIRFPSDGNMKDIYYPISEARTLSDWRYGKAKVLREFFAYLHEGLHGTGAVLSADLFGMITTNTDDLNIGQVLEYTAPYFDYIAPMVYPSHYPRGFNGWQNPNQYPYEVVRFSMDKAVARLTASTTLVKDLGDEPIASTTPQLYTKPTYNKLKLRPWLQDFDYGGNYDIAEVRAQMQATYDAGLTSWMIWDPSNKYTRGALLSE